jgi:endonuclease YncB( thermonuclease family)
MTRRRWGQAIIGGLAFLTIIGTANAMTGDAPTPAAPPLPPLSAAPSAPLAVPVPGAPSAALTEPEPLSNGERAAVLRVVDGDTIDLTDGRTVRILGIDSCEMKTAAGEDAKTAAELLVSDGAVTLTGEPAADKDRYGRILRYVTLPDGTDFGEQMVPWDHTGVYGGKPNDASPGYLERLYAVDTKYAMDPPAGRNCGGPAVSENSYAQPSPNSTDDDTDRPRTKGHTGNTGHPCLPGERDGDGDGYCGEGRR